MVESVTPHAGLADTVATAETAVKVADAVVNGGLITNPASAAGQGLAYAQPLYVDPVGACADTEAGGTIFALMPGETWRLIPGQSTPTFVNSKSSGHHFSVVLW